MKPEFDLTVIGGGPGGYVAAIRAAQLGLQVALIEARDLGGTCLNRGCIPTKALLHSAEVYQLMQSAAKFGVSAENIHYDYQKIAARKDSVVKQLRAGVTALLKSNGVAIINGQAAIQDKNTIVITGSTRQTVFTGQMVIATGSRPLKPPIPGIESPFVMDSDQVLRLESCPERIIIIGGGVIGVEFATVFQALGKEVTIIEMMDTILPGIDREIAAMLRKSLEKKGITIHTGARVTAIKSEPQAACDFEWNGVLQTVAGECVIVAIGRKPNSEQLGLEPLGITLERGFIPVNDRLETAVPGIYAIGDVTGKVLLAHAASAQGLVAAANAAGRKESMDYGIIPSCIYTNPEIAAVGITEREAVQKGLEVKVGKFPVNANGKSVMMGESEGIAKIVTKAGDGEILGAQIMAPRATDMIAEIAVAMKAEATIEEVAAAVHPHPTVSEILMEAAHDVGGVCVHKPKR